MKRARAAPPMFDDDSDSETASPARNRRRPNFKPFDTNSPLINKGQKSIRENAESKEEAEPDSLEAFMNTLKETPIGLPERPEEELEGESSDDGIIVLREVPKEKLGDRLGDGEGEDSGAEDDRLRGTLARDLVLPVVDHASRIYIPVVESGYVPLPKYGKLTDEELLGKLRDVGASVTGACGVVPVEAFEDLALALPKELLNCIIGMYERPTAIQRVAIPLALEGRDIIGVAKTGSGKTVAYGIPLLCHVVRQGRGNSMGGKGPTALIVAPTRELALQISGVLKKLGDGMQVGVMCVVGGHAKYEQFKRLRDGGAEVVVCTPGRLIDMLKMKACGLSRCSFIVLDEADRMLDMGFEPQVDAILSQIRPDAQKLLFSATFPKTISVLAKEYLTKHVRVTIGHISSGEGAQGLGSGNEDGKGALRRKVTPVSTVPMVSENVTEAYHVFSNEAEKETWLLAKLDDFLCQGLVIVFCNSRGASAALANVIRTAGKPAACVHGETDPADREGLIHMFRSGELPLLITTELNARGLDVADIKNVVNYGCAKNWEWHVHRVGRTGRANERGSAHTLICRDIKVDMAFVGLAITAYRKARVRIPDVLLQIEPNNRERGRNGRQRGRGFRGRRPHR